MKSLLDSRLLIGRLIDPIVLFSAGFLQWLCVVVVRVRL